MAITLNAILSILLSAFHLTSFMSYSAAISNPIATTHDLGTAKNEMEKANHFTFVTLLNMSPANQIPGNITFLMPNDRALAEVTIPDNSVLDFLLRHSIPSPLLLDDLTHFPTGSVIPSSEPDYVLRITNNGRRSFLLNAARIISPNICTSGKSIRCHGVDKVLTATGSVPPSPACSSDVPIPTAPPEALPATPSPQPPAQFINFTPAAAPRPTGLPMHPHKSGASREPSLKKILGYLATAAAQAKMRVKYIVNRDVSNIILVAIVVIITT